jgi:hypothetical protein
MKYEVIRSCVILGVPHAVGSQVDLDDNSVINALMGIGRILPVAESAVIEDRSIALTESSPKPKTRAKKK